MKNVIKDQLSKVKSVNVDFDDNSYFIRIPKQTSILNSSLDRNCVYIIEITDLSSSLKYNTCEQPKHKYYKVELCDKVGTKYRFNGIPVVDGIEIYTESIYYWLDDISFKVLEKC